MPFLFSTTFGTLPNNFVGWSDIAPMSEMCDKGLDLATCVGPPRISRSKKRIRSRRAQMVDRELVPIYNEPPKRLHGSKAITEAQDERCGESK